MGLSEAAKSHLQSARMLTAELDIFRCQADAASKLMSDRDPNEAYLTRIPGQQYALFFPNGGSVGLDLSQDAGTYAVKWLDISRSQWVEAEAITAGNVVTFETPGKGYWAALLKQGGKALSE